MKSKVSTLFIYFGLFSLLFFYLVKDIQTNKTPNNDLILIVGKDDTGDSSRADMIILASLDYQKKSINLLSIPRDSYLPIACKEKNQEDKIAHAYSIGQQKWPKNGGGMACLEVTISQTFDLKTITVLEVEMENFKAIIDKMGSINIKSSFTFCTKYQCYKKGSNYQLDGNQALEYVRHRQSLPNGDIDRSQNQRDLIISFFNDYKQLDAIEKTKMATYIYTKVKTDYPLKKILNLLNMKFENGKINSVVLKGNNFKKNGIYYYQLDKVDLNYYQKLFKNIESA